MTDKHIITDGCEFQSDCIEYKDISYLKIMPICAIHELSIACHDKVNKCKYYKLYKQLKAKEQECEELKKQVEIFTRQLEKANKEVIKEKEKNAKQRQKNEKYEQTLTEIKEIAEPFCDACQEFEPEKNKICMYCNYGKILQKISECEVKNEN